MLQRAAMALDLDATVPDPRLPVGSPPAVGGARADRRPARDEDLARARGRLHLAFAARPGAPTRLAVLGQQSPFRALMPREGSLEATAVLLNTAGGVCGDDRMEAHIEVREGAAATVTTQAAEKVYRALGSPARLTTRLDLEAGARLHWAPQETILFDAARLERRTEIRLAPGARVLAAETLVFGRRAMGERLSFLDLRDDWRLERDGVLVWADALRLRGAPPEALGSPAGLAGGEALATLVYAAGGEGGGAETARDVARGCAPEDAVAFGATELRGVMLARMLGPSRSVRRALTRVLSALRVGMLDFGPRLPRVWSC